MQKSATRFLPLAGVIAVALAARVACLLSLRGDLSIRVPLLDALYYMTTATGLAEGHGWPPGPHFMAPIYPWLLSGVFHVARPSVLAVQWAQLLLGIGTTTFVYLAARRAGEAAALTAGLLYALCGPAIAYENQVLAECLLAFCLALLVWMTSGEGPLTLPSCAAAGLAAGVATAGRPTYALLIPGILWLAARPKQPATQRALGVIAVLVGFGLVVGPPSVRNLRETGHWSFVTTSGGLNLYIGNHEGASGIYSQPPGLFLEKDPTGTRSASQMAGRDLSADEASRFFTERALSFLTGHPARAARLWLRKAGYLIGPEEIPQIESVDQLERDHPSLRIFGAIGFAVLFPLALLGLSRAAGRSRLRSACAGVLGTGAAAHLIFFSTGRYRAALLPAFAVLAGWGAVLAYEAIRDARRALPRLWPLALGVALLLIAPRYDRKAALAWAKHQSGIRFEQLGTFHAAEQMYAEAVAIDSTLGESWHNMAACEVREGQRTQAIHNYEVALRHLGENPVTLYNLAILYGSMQMDERAVGYFDRSLAADASDPAVRVDRGVALFRLNRTEEALADWRQVAARHPDDPNLLRTLTQLSSLGVTLPPDLARLSGRN